MFTFTSCIFLFTSCRIVFVGMHWRMTRKINRGGSSAIYGVAGSNHSRREGRQKTRALAAGRHIDYHGTLRWRQVVIHSGGVMGCEVVGGGGGGGVGVILNLLMNEVHIEAGGGDGC